MNRRFAIQQLVILTAGSTLLRSCATNGTDKIALKNIQVSASQQDMLNALTQTIIPTTNTPGAKEVRAHAFVLKMVDDCYSPADQQKFMNGMVEYDEAADKKKLSSNASDFFRTVKMLTVQCYTTSEYYMKKVMNYNIIPKKYKGCVSIN